MKVYYDKDADLSLVKGKKVTIIGYGSQGHAHAQNLQESGIKVTVALRKGGASWDKAKKGGVKVAEMAEAIKGADIVMVLLPDEHHAQVYKEFIEPNMKKGGSLAFAHGFNIHYGLIQPRADIDVWMVAPTEDASMSRMTIVTSGSEDVVEQITKQLNKLIEVVKVIDLSEAEHIERELMLIKVRAGLKEREDMKRMADIFRGRIIDVSDNTYTIELTGDGAKLDAFIKSLDQGSIIETVRTGASGIGRGNRVLRV